MTNEVVRDDMAEALTRARGKVPYSPSGTLPGEYWRGYTAAIDEVRALLAEHPAPIHAGASSAPTEAAG